MRRAELIGILFFLLLGAHIVQQSTLLPYTEKYGPGPGFLPLWVGWVIIALALLHLLNVFVLTRHAYGGPQPFPTGMSLGRVGIAFVILLATVLVMEKLGLLIASVAMVATILLGIERIQWYRSLLAAVVISVIFYTLFQVILGVPFPRGPLGI